MRSSGGIFDPEALERSLAALNAKAEDSNLWNDPKAAQKVMRDRTALEKRLADFRALERGLTENRELLAMAEADGEAGLIAEAEAGLRAAAAAARKAQIATLLSGEADANDAYLEVHAGAGGTESQDWAEMLARMYMRWAEQHGYEVEWLEESAGEEAGLKSATVQIKGHNAYGWLRTESGVHRLVRISPFDANARRHTSFASVWVYPVVDDSINIEILEKDLRVDTYRASGAGGQHVNKTESAVRLTHIPTGIVAACQSERSQHQNRGTAMKMLKARLYEVELQKQLAVTQAAHDAKTDIGWGHQIRSYVLQPYQIVKDVRTGVEKGNAQAVLDGDLDEFLEGALSRDIGGAKAAQKNGAKPEG